MYGLKCSVRILYGLDLCVIVVCGCCFALVCLSPCVRCVCVLSIGGANGKPLRKKQGERESVCVCLCVCTSVVLDTFIAPPYFEQ